MVVTAPSRRVVPGCMAFMALSLGRSAGEHRMTMGTWPREGVWEKVAVEGAGATPPPPVVAYPAAAVAE